MANRPSEEELARLKKIARSILGSGALTRVWDLGCGTIDAHKRRTLRRLLREELYSEKFAEFIREAVTTPSPSPFAAIALGQMGRGVQATTTAGTVEGVVTEADDGYMVLEEPQGTIVTVNFHQTVAIQPDLTEEEPV